MTIESAPFTGSAPSLDMGSVPALDTGPCPIDFEVIALLVVGSTQPRKGLNATALLEYTLGGPNLPNSQPKWLFRKWLPATNSTALEQSLVKECSPSRYVGSGALPQNPLG